MPNCYERVFVERQIDIVKKYISTQEFIAKCLNRKKNLENLMKKKHKKRKDMILGLKK